MSSDVVDVSTLKQRLCAILEWDPTTVDAILGSMDATLQPEEIQETCLNFMGNKPDAISLVQRYFASQRRLLENEATRFQETSAQPSKNSGLSKKQIYSNDSSNKPNGGENGKRPTTRGQPAKRANKADNSDQKKTSLSDLVQRKVVNCLRCGKIFDLRKQSEAIHNFIKSGGICDFCGNQVNLNYSSKENLDQDNAEDVQKAIEFKDRLVDYDRNAAQRTSVLDDQSDYFEIDTNVWLDEKEKKELRLRKEIEEEFSKTQRNKVHYTLDLVGRRVFVSESTAPTDQAKEIRNAALVAADSTAAELPQGGGTGAPDASKLAQKIESVYKFRVQSNPDVKVAPALFLPSKKALEESKKQKQDPLPSWVHSSGGRLQHDDVFAAFDEDFEQEVISTDLTAYSDLFDGLDNGVFDLCPNTGSNSNGLHLTGVKTEASISANTRLSTMLVPDPDSSICIANGPDLPHVSSNEHLPDGVVLLKDWLSFEDQIKIIETVRNLGTGPGGFYTPGYGTEAKLKLKMMCLGMNWNPVNRVYEKTRSNFDGASAPPLPEFIKALVKGCMKDASRLRGRPFSQMEPNICLCNFYAKDSLLGLHQDREEGSESLKRQIPVVSFSIGATGEFVFNSTRSMETAKSILLESGDALIFGGPSRMVFHGIRKIFPESMPQELADLTGMRNGRLNLTIRQYIPEP